MHSTLKHLSGKLDDLSAFNDLIAKHGAALQRSLSELENLKLPAESGEKIKAVNERATLFRITSNAMINVSEAPAAAYIFGRGVCVCVCAFVPREAFPPRCRWRTLPRQGGGGNREGQDRSSQAGLVPPLSLDFKLSVLSSLFM